MTVPQDATLCFGLGMAAHLAYAAGPSLDSAATKRAVATFAAGWVPLTTVLLVGWPDWSWWYWDALAGRTDLALIFGLILEVGGFALGLKTTQALSPPARLKGLAVLGGVYTLLLVLPWSRYSRVGSHAQFEIGEAPWLWEALDLMGVLAVGGMWFVGVTAYGAWSIYTGSRAAIGED